MTGTLQISRTVTASRKPLPWVFARTSPLSHRYAVSSAFLGDEQPADGVGHQIDRSRGAGKRKEPFAPGLDRGEQQEYGSRLPERHGDAVPADPGEDEVPGAHRAEERRDDRHALPEQIAQEEIQDDQGGEAGRRRRELAREGDDPDDRHEERGDERLERLVADRVVARRDKVGSEWLLSAEKVDRVLAVHGGVVIEPGRDGVELVEAEERRDRHHHEEGEHLRPARKGRRSLAAVGQGLGWRVRSWHQPAQRTREDDREQRQAADVQSRPPARRTA